MFKKMIILGIGLLFCVSIPSIGFAAGVTLAWDASSGEVNGYRIYYGTSQGTYPSSVDTGNVTEYALTGLQDGTTYYFVARAYNDFGESENSNEVSWTSPETPIDHTPPLPPAGVSVE